MRFLNPKEIAFLMVCARPFRAWNANKDTKGFVDGRRCYGIARSLASERLVREVGFGHFQITSDGSKAIPERYWPRGS